MKRKAILIGVIFLLLVNLTSAQSLEDKIRQSLGIIKEKVNETVLLAFCLIWWIIAALAALLIVWNGVKYMNSENIEERNKAKGKIIQTIVGLIVVLIACPFINFLVKGTQISEFKCECLPKEETPTTPINSIATTTIEKTTTTSTISTSTSTTTSTTSITTSTTTTLKDILIYEFAYNRDDYSSHNELISLLRDAGYSVDRKVRSGEDITKNLLSNYKQVWFFDGGPEEIIPEEVNSLVDYHNEGGAIFLSGYPSSCCRFPDYAKNVGKISQRFNVRMDDTSIGIEGCSFCSGIHPIVDSVAEISSYKCSIKISSNDPNTESICSTPILDTSILVLEPSNGKGKIVFDGNLMRFIDMLYPEFTVWKTGIKSCDNSQYALNIASWLSG